MRSIIVAANVHSSTTRRASLLTKMAVSTLACDEVDAGCSAQVDRADTKPPSASAKLRVMDWNTVSTVIPTALSASVYVVAHTAFLATMRRTAQPPVLSVHPWVSILKPIAGVDDDLRGNLASFAQ